METSPLLSRVPHRVWVGVDGVVAVLLTGVYVMQASTPHIMPGWGWLGVVFAVPAALPLAVRRRWPLPVAAVVTVASVVLALHALVGDPFLPVAYATYVVGTTQPRRVSVPAFTLIEVSVLFSIFATPLPTKADPIAAEWTRALASGLVIGAAFAIGFATRIYRHYLAGVTEQARLRTDAQLAEAARVVSEERLRIARELHDVVAHSMSVIAVQAGVGHYLLDSQPGQARQVLDVIETTSREALGEMRTLLGILRDGSRHGDTTDLAPSQGIRDLDALVARTSEAGVATQLSVTGQPRPLPAGIELTAYRIIQEALTNVVKHAGAPHCVVSIRYGDADLVIEIVDQGRGAAEPLHAGGHGLIGMRERVSVYGGQLTVGPLPQRGFRVAARIPITLARAT